MVGGILPLPGGRRLWGDLGVYYIGMNYGPGILAIDNWGSGRSLEEALRDLRTRVR
jgi:hypothetical protein